MWTLLETVILFGLSVMKYFSAYNFMTEEMQEKIVNKTTILNTMIAEKEADVKCVTGTEPVYILNAEDAAQKIKIEGEEENAENTV